MKIFTVVLLFLFISFSVNGQNEPIVEIGTVSYLSSQNTYVKFASTDEIEIGDTLFLKKGEVLLPVLEVTNKSSSSCVCSSLGNEKLEVSNEIVAILAKPENEKPEEQIEEPIETDINNNLEPTPLIQEAIIENEEEIFQPKQNIRARLSAATYSTLSNHGNNHRMRYAFNYRGNNINDSRFSFENYTTFRHTQGEWDNLGAALRIYSLAGRYDFDKSSSITLGRRINPKMSSMGAIDGVQYEKGFGQFFVGGILGSRPDNSDYGFNLNLLQAGAFVGHISEKKYERSTLGFVEQRNGGEVDRRFVYFQHSSNLAKNLNLFGSAEMDAYEKVNNEVNAKPRLTNLYVSLRYRVSRKLTISGSYDNRKNIIYYESYKSYIEQLIDQETRQGFRFGLNIRPIKYVTIGANANWRFQQSNMNLSKNLNSYLNISRVPGIHARASLTANFLQTNYLDSKIFGIRLSKDFLKNKLSGEIYFRLVDYQYRTSNYSIQQKIGGASLNVRIAKNLSLYLYYEGTFDGQGNDLTRFNTKIIQRF